MISSLWSLLIRGNHQFHDTIQGPSGEQKIRLDGTRCGEQADTYENALMDLYDQHFKYEETLAAQNL